MRIRLASGSGARACISVKANNPRSNGAGRTADQGEHADHSVAIVLVHVRQHAIRVRRAARGGERRQLAVTGNQHVAETQQPAALRGGEQRCAHRASPRICSAALQERAMMVNEGLIPGALGKTLESAA